LLFSASLCSTTPSPWWVILQGDLSSFFRIRTLNCVTFDMINVFKSSDRQLQILTYCFYNIDWNILPSMSWSSKRSHTIRFFTQNVSQMHLPLFKCPKNTV
jgi:hypothetical protein